MTGILPRACIWSALLPVLLIPPLARGSGPGAAQNEGETIPGGFNVTVDVRVVTLAVAVLDKKGRYRTDLGQDEFIVEEDGQPVPIRGFRLTEDEPLDLAILLDVSGSMRFDRKIDRARWVIRQLAARLREDERAALLIFADGRVETSVPFTFEKEQYLQTLDAIKAYGKTALGDALDEASRLIENEDTLAPALILLTDGFDNASQLGMAEALSRLRWRGIPVYPIAVVAGHIEEAATHPDAGSDFALMQRIAEETGGRFFVVTSPASMSIAVAGIEKDLRSRYRIDFRSKDRDGVEPRRLRVYLRKKDFRVRYRSGYRP